MHDRGGTRSACLSLHSSAACHPHFRLRSLSLSPSFYLSICLCVCHVYALLASNVRLSRSRSACSYTEGTIIVRRGLTRGCGSSEVIEPRPWKPASTYSLVDEFQLILPLSLSLERLSITGQRVAWCFWHERGLVLASFW